MRITIATTIATILATTLTGCGSDLPDAPRPTTSAPMTAPAPLENATASSTTAATSPAGTAATSDLLPLADRATAAGVTLALAESWERKGVHITNTGAIYADDCSIARSVTVPSGKRIIC